MTRELSDEAVAYQAEQLAEYLSRGGAASRWLDSKDFTSEDRAAVLLAYTDAQEEAS